MVSTRFLSYYLIKTHFVELNKNCTHYQTSGQSESNEFRQINTFQNINSAEYIIKIILYVLGEKDARIVFSDSDSTNWRDHGYYEVGNSICDFEDNIFNISDEKKNFILFSFSLLLLISDWCLGKYAYSYS